MKDIEIGFMQGRLCNQVEGKIQAFPINEWKIEYEIAKSYGFSVMEWTLDHDELLSNPLMTADGRHEIKLLSEKFDLNVRSITGDCFMQYPFFKYRGAEAHSLLNLLSEVLSAAAQIGAKYLVFPLVDNSSIKSEYEENGFVNSLLPLSDYLAKNKLKILFESDFEPKRLAKFINKFPEQAFGINYDIGNSAALGYLPYQEIHSYGDRILNVHVKDRVLGGATVPLGEGNAKFNDVFSSLKKMNYSGDLILQTARASDGDHIRALTKYRAQTKTWWERCEFTA